MIEEKLIEEELYKKYIEPTKKKRNDYIGIEIEIPILNYKKQAVNFQTVFEVTDQFMKEFGFRAEGIDDEGHIYSAVNPQNGDILSYDCSYNNLELSLGKEVDLHTLYQRFQKYYRFLQKKFNQNQHRLTGMGVNPYRIYNHNVPIPNGRYRMLFHHLGSYKKYQLPMYFHDYPEFGTFSSASQVQLDISYDKLLETLEAFSKLEPIKALLFSNSVLLDSPFSDLLCCRDMFWEQSTLGINPHNIGMYDCSLESIDDLLAYIESTSIYCLERDGKYINFSPIRIMEYFKQSEVTGEYFDGNQYREIQIIPRIEDINYLRTFKFEDLTFRGTVEFRSVCCQPIQDCMTVSAFHLGLKNHVEELNSILQNDHVLYHKGYTATELRKMLVKRELPDFVCQDQLYTLAEKIVDLSKKGLKQRGFHEEVFLNPLYERIQNHTNPAKAMLEHIEQGGNLESVIESYGKL